MVGIFNCLQEAVMKYGYLLLRERLSSDEGVCLHACLTDSLYVLMTACLYVSMTACLYVLMTACLYVWLSHQMLASLCRHHKASEGGGGGWGGLQVPHC